MNLPFGTQGRSRRLKPFSYKQEMGDTERLLVCGRAPRVLPGFSSVPVFPFQVDKGVVPLAGTDGETTTQGTGGVVFRTTELLGGCCRQRTE